MWSVRRLVTCKKSSLVLPFATLSSKEHECKEEHFPTGLSREVFRFGLRNDVEGLWQFLQGLSGADNQRLTPQFLDDAAFILSEAQNKQGIMLISSLAQTHFPEHFDAMGGYMTFQPVKWSRIQLNQSVKHFEDLYMIKQPKAFAQLGRTFRSGLLYSYLNDGITSEFLVLHNLVNDIWHFWKDEIPLVALWEILFCSPREEDEKFSKEMWRLNYKLILGADLFPSLIFTLYVMGDYQKLTRLKSLMEENKQWFKKSTTAGISGVIDSFLSGMNYLNPWPTKPYRFQLNRTLMSELRKKEIHFNANNPKKYFLTGLSIKQILAPPIPIQIKLK